MKKISSFIIICIIILSIIFVGCTKLTSLYSPNGEDIVKSATSVEVNSSKTKKTSSYTISYSWNEPVTFNTIYLFEKSNNKATNVEIFLDDSTEYVYKQDEVGSIRCAYIGNVTAKKVKITVESTIGKVKIKDVKILNMPRNRNDFRSFSYVVLGENGTTFDSYDLEGISHLTDVVLFETSELSFNEKGELHINDNVIKHVVKTIRETNPNIKIHACFLPSSSNSDIATLGWPNNIIAIHNGAFDSGIFADNLKNAVEEYGFDGIGLDYEYPGSNSDYKNYSSFMKILKSTLPTNIETTYAITFNCREMDWANTDNLLVMSYDFIGRDNAHSSWADGIEKTIISTSRNNIPKDKLVIGLPFYSRPNAVASKWNLAKYWGDYKIDVDKLGKFTNMLELNEERHISETETLFIEKLYFNSYQLISDKTAFAYDYGAKGVMVWNYGCDVEYSNPLSLLKAINESSK